MSTAKFDTLSNLAGTQSVPVATVAQELQDYIEYREGKLFWKKKPSQPVRVGQAVGSEVDGYLRFKFKGVTYANHRVVFFLHHGFFPELVDHKNGNTMDNSIDNLRPANHSQNKANSKPHNDRAAKGAYKLSSGRYMSVIQSNGNRVYLGVFDTPESASQAYAQAAAQYHGDFARAA